MEVPETDESWGEYILRKGWKLQAYIDDKIKDAYESKWDEYYEKVWAGHHRNPNIAPLEPPTVPLFLEQDTFEYVFTMLAKSVNDMNRFVGKNDHVIVDALRQQGGEFHSPNMMISVVDQDGFNDWRERSKSFDTDQTRLFSISQLRQQNVNPLVAVITVDYDPIKIHNASIQREGKQEMEKQRALWNRSADIPNVEGSTEYLVPYMQKTNWSCGVKHVWLTNYYSWLFLTYKGDQLVKVHRRPRRYGRQDSKPGTSREVKPIYIEARKPGVNAKAGVIKSRRFNVRRELYDSLFEAYSQKYR